MSALQLHPTQAEINNHPDPIQSETFVDNDNPSETENERDSIVESTFVDTGPPLPEDYDLDIIRAMVQDPFRIFVYWDLRPRSIDALTGQLTKNSSKSFRTTLRLINLDDGTEAFFDVERRGGYWVEAIPGSDYEFEIGVRSAALGYHSILRSNRVRVPNRTVSIFVARDPEYHVSPAQFIQVMEASGFGALASESLINHGECEAFALEADEQPVLGGRSSFSSIRRGRSSINR